MNLFRTLCQLKIKTQCKENTFNCFYSTLTKDKRIHDNTGDGCSDHKAKSNVGVKIRGEGSTSAEHSLNTETDEDDDPATVPGTRRNFLKLGTEIKHKDY